MVATVRTLIFAVVAAVWTGANAHGSTADDIAKYESGGALAVDPTEEVVEAPKDMKLILCIGQSNMAGRAKMTDEDRQVVPNAYKLNRDNKWVAAKSPYHFDRKYAAVGPVDDFVRLYLKDHPGETVGVVPCAVGGTSVTTWIAGGDKGPGANFSRALERAKAAAANGRFIAILWHQGETDAAKYDEKALMKTYPARVKGIAEALRAELGGEEIPFIVGEIGRWQRKDGDHAARINPCINKVAEILPRSAVVTSEGLTNRDEHHFDRESQRKLAERYYEAFKRLSEERPLAMGSAKWKNGAACAVTYTFDDGLLDQYTIAYPMFREAGLPATFFIIGSKVGDAKGMKSKAERDTPLMTWDNIREMAANGMEIASHGWGHAKYSRMDRAAILDDILRNCPRGGVGWLPSAPEGCGRRHDGRAHEWFGGRSAEKGRVAHFHVARPCARL